MNIKLHLLENLHIRTLDCQNNGLSEHWADGEISLEIVQGATLIEQIIIIIIIID